MHCEERRVESLDDLRELVAQTLCEREQLEPGAFPLTDRLLHQGGRPCGMEFCQVGPRAVRLMAIWEAAQRTVLFYDSTGERFHRVRLTDSLIGILAEATA